MAIEVRDTATSVLPQVLAKDNIFRKLDVDSLYTPINVPAMVLDLAIKAGILEDLLQTDQIEQERLPEYTKWGQDTFLSKFVNPNYSAEGIDNIRNAKEEAKKNNQRVVYSLRHDGDADHLIWRYIFNHEGLEEEANNTVFAAGANMLKRPGIRLFMRAEHVVYIATPADIIRARTLYREGDKVGLDNEDKELMEWAYGIFIATDEKAKEKFEGVKERGETIAVYGEAGRPYDGFMKRITRYIAGAYFPEEDDLLVVSMKMFGAREFNPPNKTFRAYKIIPRFRQHIGLRAGQAYSSKEIWNWKRRPNDSPGDMIAAHLANLDQSNIRLSDLVRYQRLMNIYHKDTSQIWLPEGLEELMTA